MTDEELHEHQLKHLAQRFEDWMPVLQGAHNWPVSVELVPPIPEGFFALPEPAETFAEGYGVRFEDNPRIESNPPGIRHLDPVELQISFPGGELPSSGEWAEAIWEMAVLPHISFEIVSTSGQVIVQFACDESQRRAVRIILSEHLPGVSIREERRFLVGQMGRKVNPKVVDTDAIYDYGLSKHFFFPLCSWQPDFDPLEPIVDTLLRLESDEMGSFQVFFQALPDSIDTELRKYRFLDTEEQRANLTRLFPGSEVAPTKRKLSRPLLAARVRVLLRTNSEEYTRTLLTALDMCFASHHEKDGNYLGRFVSKGHEYRMGSGRDRMHFAWRESERSGMLLSRDEVLSLVHLPLSRIHNSKLRLLPERAKQVASRYVYKDVRPGQAVLGSNRHDGDYDIVAVDTEVRSRHTHIIGASGTGKSTLLFNMISMDIFNGCGVAVIDPHGDLIEKVLDFVPDMRRDDVLLLDPSDEQYPIGFNILAAHSSAEKNILATDLVAVFRRLSTTWGDQMNSVLANAILAMLESTRGGTLVDLLNFLVEKDFRLKFLETVRDERVRHYWTKQFPLLSGHPQGPILTRLDAFLRPQMIRNMVMQKDNKFDFASLMNGKKIVLAKLTHGAIGAENANLLGSLLVSGFHMAALGRHSMAKEDRSLFNLYIDEFHNFVTPSVSSILSGGRKYGLGLTLAHQDLQQLSSRDEELASAVLSNSAVRVCYRVGEADAKKLAEGFSFFTANDILNLQRGEAVCRIDTKDNDFNLSTVPLDKFLEEGGGKIDAKQKELIVAASRARYATPLATLSPAPPEPAPSVSESPKSDPPAPAEKPRPRSEAKPKSATPEERRQHDEAVPAASKAETASPGVGKGLHDYFKRLIKNRGEELGYFVEKEKTVLNGAGRVDVLLTRNEKTIACEISVTNSPGYEVENIKKCLAAGFDIVAFITNEQKKLNQVRRLAADIEAEGRAKLRFFSPEEFDVFLEEQAAKEVSSESVTRGRSVKTNYKAPLAKDTAARKKVISKIIAAAIKRLKKGP